MSSKPLVSVITPSYNRKDFIDEAINSVLAQTYDNWELIIVDDGSTDGTAEHIERYLKDERIKYFYQKNQGQSPAQNKGLEHAVGEYIAFLDSDNRWLPHKLDVSVNKLSNSPAFDILYTEGQIIDESGKIISEKSTMKRFSGKITYKLLADNFVGINSSLVRKKCFDQMGGFSKYRKVADDYKLWLKFSVRYKFIFLDDVTYQYRVMTNQVSSDKIGRFKSNEETLLSTLDKFKSELDETLYLKGLSRFYTRKASWLFSVKDYKKGIAAIIKALKYDALWKGPYKVIVKMLRSMLFGPKH